MKCPKCGRTDHEPGAKFCHKCGTELMLITMKCPNCNATDHKPGTKFCQWCGTKLIIISEPPKPTPADDPVREPIESPQPTPVDASGREAIDLGLSSGTKWASCNVGATRPEEYGGYYAWGETEEKSRYDWKTYKYGSSEDNCQDLGADIAGTQYDVAHVKWGGPWVMPSFDQIKELLANCSSKWTSLNGVKGRKFTGPNGNSIFLPAAGYRYGSSLSDDGGLGGYWSGTQSTSYSGDAYNLGFGSVGAGWYGDNRRDGQGVRPVAR